MENIIAENLIHRALVEYETVQQELNKPRRDLVMYAACELVKNAIIEFLAAFLFERGKLANTSEDLIELQEHCIEIDPRFQQLHLRSITCLHLDDSSMIDASDHDSLQKYVDILEQTKELVLSILGEQ